MHLQSDAYDVRILSENAEFVQPPGSDHLVEWGGRVGCVIGFAAGDVVLLESTSCHVGEGKSPQRATNMAFLIPILKTPDHDDLESDSGYDPELPLH